MIIDSLDNASKYYGMHPLFEKALDFLRSGVENMQDGVYELQGKDLYATICSPELRERHDAKLEAHDIYIDIQYLMCSSEDGNMYDQEGYGWAAREDLKIIDNEISDAKRDLTFYEEDYKNCITLKGGQFIVFWNTDAHAPLIHVHDDSERMTLPSIRKVIVKVKI